MSGETAAARALRKAAARGEGAIEDSVVRMALGRVPRNRLAFGRAANALGAVAARDGAVAAALDLLAEAHERLIATGDDAARLIFKRRARGLGDALRASRAGGLTAAVRELDELMAQVRPRSGRLAAGTIRPNWWDRLFELAERDPAVREAYLAFQDACATGDIDLLEAAAAALREAVGGKLSMSKAKAFADRINGVVRRLKAVTASGDGVRVLTALNDFLDALDPADPVRRAVSMMADAVRTNADHWFTVGRLVAGMKAAETPEQARGLCWRLKGLLGEMLTMSTKAYRQAYAAALADAEALAVRLNRTEKGWEVVTRRSQVRAPGSKNSARLGQFYDDAILVRRVVPGTGRMEAIVVLATQVKSSDLATAGVIDQIRKDVDRSLSGIIEMDGIQYTLRSGLEFNPTRIFVGTNLPPRAAADAASAAGTAVGAIVLPMGGDDIERVAQALLVSNRLVPADLLAKGR